MLMQEARELNIGGLRTATTYIARVQALDVTGSAGLSTSILFTTPLLQTGSNGSLYMRFSVA